MRHTLAVLKHDAEQSRIMDSTIPTERKVAPEKVPESINIPSNFNDAILRDMAESKNDRAHASHKTSPEKKNLEPGSDRHSETLAAGALRMVQKSKTTSQRVKGFRSDDEDLRDPAPMDERRALLNESVLGRSKVEDVAPLPFHTTDPTARYDQWLSRSNTHLAITAAAERRAEQAKRVSEQVAEIRASLNPNLPVKKAPPKQPQTKPTPKRLPLERPHPQQKLMHSSAGQPHPQKEPAQFPAERHQSVNQTKRNTSSIKDARRSSRRVEEAKKISARVAEIRASLNSMGKKTSVPTCSPVASMPNGGTWECPQCTLSNAKWNTVCEACLFEKSIHEETTARLKAPPIRSVPHQKAPPAETTFQQKMPPGKQESHYKKQQTEEFSQPHFSQSARHNYPQGNQSIQFKERTHRKPSVRGIDPTPSVTFARQLTQPWDSSVQIVEPSLLDQDEIEAVVQPISHRSEQREQSEPRVQPRDPSERRTRTIPIRDLSPPRPKRIEEWNPKQDQTRNVIHSEKFEPEDRDTQETGRFRFVDPPSSDEREGDVDPPSTGFDPPAHLGDGGNAYQEDDILYQEEDAQYQEDEYQIQENASQHVFKRLNNYEVVAPDEGGLHIGLVDNSLSGRFSRVIVPSAAQSHSSNRRNPGDEKGNFLTDGLVSILDAYGVDRLCGVDEETLKMELMRTQGKR